MQGTISRDELSTALARVHLKHTGSHGNQLESIRGIQVRVSLTSGGHFDRQGEKGCGAVMSREIHGVEYAVADRGQQLMNGSSVLRWIQLVSQPLALEDAERLGERDPRGVH